MRTQLKIKTKPSAQPNGRHSRSLAFPSPPRRGTAARKPSSSSHQSTRSNRPHCPEGRVSPFPGSTRPTPCIHRVRLAPRRRTARMGTNPVSVSVDTLCHIPISKRMSVCCGDVGGKPTAVYCHEQRSESACSFCRHPGFTFRFRGIEAFKGAHRHSW